MSDTIELKPCPFCGREAALKEFEHDYLVRCSAPAQHSGLIVHTTWFATAEEAAHVWNTRHEGCVVR